MLKLYVHYLQRHLVFIELRGWLKNVYDSSLKLHSLQTCESCFEIKKTKEIFPLKNEIKVAIT